MKSYPIQGLPLEARLTPLEELGVVTPDLIHDANNQLAVAVGNLEMARIESQPPEARAQALATALTAVNELGRLVANTSKVYRRAIPCAMNFAAADVAGRIQSANPAPARWTCEIAAPVTGNIALNPRWAAFAVWHLAQHAAPKGGRVCISRQPCQRLLHPPPGAAPHIKNGDVLCVDMQWEMPEPLPWDAQKQRPVDARLWSAQRLFRCASGWFHAHHAEGRQQVLMVAPVIDLPQKPNRI